MASGSTSHESVSGTVIPDKGFPDNRLPTPLAESLPATPVSDGGAGVPTREVTITIDCLPGVPGLRRPRRHGRQPLLCRRHELRLVASPRGMSGSVRWAGRGDTYVRRGRYLVPSVQSRPAGTGRPVRPGPRSCSRQWGVLPMRRIRVRGTVQPCRASEVAMGERARSIDHEGGLTE